MTKFLLAVHVLAAILAIGPVAVAASMFPAAARRGDAATLSTLHRICRVYAVLGLVVPVFGFATASALHVLGSVWLITSMTLTALAALLLGLVILPGQERIIAEPDGLASVPRLAMLTGVFNLLWATVTILMIVRPGSTTGA
jgi:hypothetical protein